MTRFLAVTDSAPFVQRVTGLLSGELDDSDLRVLGSEVVDLPAVALLPPPGEAPIDVVLLGPGIERERSLLFAAALDETFPHLTVVLVEPFDADLPYAAMRAGVRDLLDPEAGDETLRDVLGRSRRAAASRRRDSVLAGVSGPKPKIIVVVSPKGGVGKTTLATNMAVALGKSAPMTTVLVDLDAQFGDVANALRLQPEHTLTEAVGSAAAFDSMVLKAYLTVHEAGIYALCAPEDPAAADRISAEAVTHLLHQLASEFAYVVVDTAAGLDDHTLAALEAATDALFVVSLDVPSVRGLRKELDVLGELGLVPARRHLIVNFAEPSSGLSVADVEATVGMPVSAVLRRSSEIALSTNTGTPLLMSRSRSRAGALLTRVAALLDESMTGRTSRRRARIT